MSGGEPSDTSGVNAQFRRRRSPSRRKLDWPRLTALGRTLLESYKGLAVFLLNSLVLLVCVEICATLVSAVRLPRASPTPSKAPTYYRSQPWSVAYWREHSQAESQIRYHPYTLWRTAVYKGEHVNVDSDGLRYTPEARCEPGSHTVFVFGGSTVWGWGAPDWGTIPAFLQRILSSSSTDPVCVVNFGQNGFVSTQDVIELLRLLQTGHVPEYAVFYGGLNDTHAFHETRRPGVHYQPDRFAAKLQRRDDELLGPLVSRLKATSTFSLSSRIATRLKRAFKVEPSRSQGAVTEPSDLPVDAYLFNYRLVSALAEQYGFRFAFVWQPTVISGRKQLRPGEDALASGGHMAPALPQIRHSYRQIQSLAGHLDRFYYLGDVFDHESGPIFVDFVHVNPEGNRIIAERIAELLRASM